MLSKRNLKLSLGFILSALILLLSTKTVLAQETGTWSTTASLTKRIANHVSIVHDDRIFIFGGSNTDDFSEIESSLPDFDGSLVNWDKVSSLPKTRYWGAISKKENRVYIVGGATFPGSQIIEDNVYSATIDSGGGFSIWEELSSLTESRALGSAAISGDRIFYAGGFDDVGKHDEVYSAKINPDGTLEPWSATPVGSLPEPMDGFGMVSYGGKIVIFGGRGVADTRISDVYEATVNPVDGSLSPWVALSSLPEGVARFGYTLVGDTVIIAGGETPAPTDKVYFAKFDSNSDLGEWQESENALPAPVGGGPTLNYLNGHLYLVGGYETDYSDKVYFAEFDDGSVDLDVTLLKQTDPLWGGDFYDSAHLWSSDTTFARWGCAVTSAAMVFDYYGLSSIDSVTPLDPGSLNSWLKSQSDGYIRNGLTNWIALSRLSNQIAGLNGVDFNALEFSREISSDHQVVKDSIDNEIPSILRVPDHFVVGSGYTEDNILISDPFYERDDMSEYDNTFQNVSRFTPSNTDLSYMMFVVDEHMRIVVTNENDSEVGHMVLEEPIADPSGSASSSAEPLKVVYVPKPASGEYKVNISSNSSEKYILDTYFYDVEGRVKQFSFEENIDDLHTYNINFDKDDNSDTEIIEHVTFVSLVNDLSSLYENGEMKNFGIYKSLNSQLQNAKRFYDANNIKLVFLDNFERNIKQYEKRGHLSTEAKDYLLTRTEILRERL